MAYRAAWSRWTNARVAILWVPGAGLAGRFYGPTALHRTALERNGRGRTLRRSAPSSFVTPELTDRPAMTATHDEYVPPRWTSLSLTQETRADHAVDRRGDHLITCARKTHLLLLENVCSGMSPQPRAASITESGTPRARASRTAASPPSPNIWLLSKGIVEAQKVGGV